MNIVNIIIGESLYKMIVSLENVTKYFGSELILKEINATINEKERIGLVGANGEGKTTLLNIIIGVLEIDDGEVGIGNGKAIGYLKQNSGLSNGRTIQKEMESVFEDILLLGSEIEHLRKEMVQVHENEIEYKRVSAIYSEKLLTYEAKDGYSIPIRINTILNGMGFGGYDRDIVTDHLSGGEKTRLAIAQLLLKEPDLLILDEPTNHLDFRTLNWLEDYLNNYRGSLLIVSHDRYFLNRLVGHIWELERTRLNAFKGNYSSYVIQKKERIERQLKEYEQQQIQIASMEDYVAKNIARASTSKSAKSRVAALARMERIEKPILWDKKASFRFSYEREPVKDIFHVEGLSLSVGEGDQKKTLCENFKMDVMRGEKIAIIGTNGIGKSSILKAIQGIIPCNYTCMDWGRNVSVSYYDQENKQLHPEKTAINEIWDRFPNMYEVDVRTILGRVLLSGDNVYKEVGNLSGGERAKVAFALMMLEHGNVLIMDEPTNHLDIASKEMLEDALEAFEGTIIMVSHDRYLLNKIPTHIMDMTADGVELYKGRYDYYIENKREVAPKVEEKTEEKKESSKKYYRSKQDRSRQVAVKKRIAQLEQLMEENDEKAEALALQMANPEIAADYQRVEEICAEIQELKNQSEDYTEEWIELGDELEESGD